MFAQAVSFMVLPQPSLPASFQYVQHLTSSWPCCHFVQIAPSQTAVMASTNGDQTWRKNVYPLSPDRMPGPTQQRRAHRDLVRCTVAKSIPNICCMHVAPRSYTVVRTCMRAHGSCLQRPLLSSLQKTYWQGSGVCLRSSRAAVLSRDRSKLTMVSSVKGCTFEVSCSLLLLVRHPAHTARRYRLQRLIDMR